MIEVTVKVHDIASDGLPDMDTLVGRVAFIWDHEIVSGWPLEDGTHNVRPDIWEANSDVGRIGPFHGVTHWVEFPDGALSP